MDLQFVHDVLTQVSWRRRVAEEQQRHEDLEYWRRHYTRLWYMLSKQLGR